MNNPPFWILELIDEFQHSANKRSDAAIARMIRVFADVDPDVMVDAVDDFIRERPIGFFPTIGELKPFVDRAVERSREIELNDDDRRKLYDSKMKRVRESIRHSDDEILEWEFDRGSIPRGELGSEWGSVDG